MCNRLLAVPVATALLLSAVWANDASAQAQPQAPAARFFEVVQVEVVNVEVIVTDRDGHWVGDLVRDEFEVLEDGKPVDLTNFMVVEEGRVVSETVAAEGAPPPPPVRPPVSLVIYIDNANLRAGSRNRVLREVRQLVGQRMMGGDRVMVVSFDRRLDINLPFTDDPQEVLMTLEDLARTSGGASGNDAERRMILRRLERPMSSEPLVEARTALNDIQAFTTSLYHDSKRAIATLQGLTTSLAGLPGRKALLFVSDGIPSRPGEDLYNAWFSVYGGYSVQLGVTHPTFESDKNSVSTDLIELVAHANASGVTFFTVSAEGLDANSEMLPEVGGLSPNGTRVSDPTLNFADVLNRVDMLQHIADATGGRAVLKATDQTLEAVAEDLERYYSLAYYAPNPGDRRTHKIEVRVRRPGLDLRYRDSHRGKPAEERAGDTAYGALWGVVEDNPFEVAMDIGTQADKNKRTFVLPVMVTFAAEKLALLPGEGEVREGSLKLFITVQDEQGDVSPVAEIPAPLRIPEKAFEPGKPTRLGYGAKLRVRPGRQSIAVCVLDEIAQQSSVARVTVNIGKSGRVILDNQPLLSDSGR